MKNNSSCFWNNLLLVCGVLGSCTILAAQTNNNTPVRIGIYDSRALAYVWFGSPARQRALQEQMQAARAAQAAGDTNRFRLLGDQLRELQAEVHREVFSTAPATGALAELKDRLPAIEKQAGVVTLISKWDEPARQRFPHAEVVELTRELVQEFQPTEKQLKVIDGLEKQKPLPLEKCEELIRQNKI